jgi:hypothetical protein
MWKIEIFVDANDPTKIDAQVLSTVEDREIALHVMSEINFDELQETFDVFRKVLAKPGTPTEEILAYRPGALTTKEGEKVLEARHIAVKG